MEIYGIYFPLMRKAAAYQSQQHRDLRKCAARKLQPCGARSACSVTPCSVSRSISKTGDCPDYGRTRTKRKVNGTIPRAKSGSKARLADARFGEFHLPSYQGFNRREPVDPR